ncbi:hypothetical protein [Halotia branconii]|uniref:Uncharacterized protein n=1 Tax=Halotia branconii CENA392 TaxID=1539056 RepID=A0AAJ6NXK7_9CYAN|nr:hypothetical protein [Halotia branconii]WGV28609.1 hypothetical protein QI031_14600 [Halotia branconii CENA392]
MPSFRVVLDVAIAFTQSGEQRLRWQNAVNKDSSYNVKNTLLTSHKPQFG